MKFRSISSATGMAFAIAASLPLVAQSIGVKPELVCLPVAINSPTANDANWTTGQRQLGQGIAMFDEGKFNLAAEHLKRALRSDGLPSGLERATAHKYLGLYYCANGSSKLCAQHFELAIDASSEITFDTGDLRTTRHREALRSAQRRVAQKRSATSGASVARTEPSASAHSSAAANGSIRLDIRPWAEVLVNNQRIVSPPGKVLTVSPGQYTVELRNPAGPTARKEISVPEGGAADVSHRF